MPRRLSAFPPSRPSSLSSLLIVYCCKNTRFLLNDKKKQEERGENDCAIKELNKGTRERLPNTLEAFAED
jgi:hypothetical protein